MDLSLKHGNWNETLGVINQSLMNLFKLNYVTSAKMHLIFVVQYFDEDEWRT